MATLIPKFGITLSDYTNIAAELTSIGDPGRIATISYDRSQLTPYHDMRHMTDGLDKLTQLAEQRWGAGNVLSSYVTVTAFRSLSHPFKTRAYNGDIHRDPEVVRRIIATVCTLPRYRAAPIVFNALDTISNIGGLRPVDVYVQRGRNGHITGVKPISQQPADQRFTDASQARIGGATEITNTDWHAVDALPLGAVRCSFIVNAKVGTPNLT